ncbi:MAG TPA: hypothetical protein VKM94_18260 [Blastocatellia bacterium]|nr:hypothetical protein [Blastocatellia bacterium]
MNSIVVSEWDPECFHRKVLDLEANGYVCRQETYRVTAEMNPETGRISHVYTIEMQREEEKEY